MFSFEREMMMKKLEAILMLVCVVGLFATVDTACAEVIAFWQFENGALTTDSSGNGHTLTSAGDPASVAGGQGGSTNCVALDGNDALYTSSNLDLSSYDWIRVSWYMKITTADVDIIYEHSSNFSSNAGGIVGSTNENSNGMGQAGVKSTTGWNVDTYAHATDDTWEYFEVEYDIRAGTAAADIVIVKEPGGSGLPGNQGTDTVPFLNDVFYLGARAGNSLYFTGNIDQFKIESIPEPGTVVLLLSGVLGLIALRVFLRRK